VEWGEYQATAPVDRDGRAAFPSLPWESIFNEADQSIASGLRFSLEPVAPADPAP
jgi:hypothetical protein